MSPPASTSLRSLASADDEAPVERVPGAPERAADLRVDHHVVARHRRRDRDVPGPATRTALYACGRSAATVAGVLAPVQLQAPDARARRDAAHLLDAPVGDHRDDQRLFPDRLRDRPRDRLVDAPRAATARG